MPRGAATKKSKERTALSDYLITKEKEDNLVVQVSDTETVTSNKRSASSVTPDDDQSKEKKDTKAEIFHKRKPS